MNSDRINFSMNGDGAGKHQGGEKPLDERNERARKALAARYDLLNQKWADAEKMLKSMQVPRSVWIEYDSEPVDPQRPGEWQICYCLGLVKYRGDWRLCHGTYDTSEGGPDNWKPVVDCSVEQRVAAAPHIGKLRERLVESAEKYISKVDRAVAEMTEALEQI